ncbi:MAG: DUF3575 domain-containing protein [Rikenellaceae bacterium]|nr:DUF3575 domain-containing protein [Rikenellaceae bacterium]
MGWATTTPNMAVEIALGRKTSFEVSGSYNPWRFGAAEDNKKIQHWVVRPEVRFWPYERWDGHFLGVHGMFISYNAGGVNIPLAPLGSLKESRYEGYGAGVGFSYGYQWYLSPHWNLEATAGIGYAYYNYDRYECWKCGDFLERNHKHWFGPTKVGVSFIYLIKSKR